MTNVYQGVLYTNSGTGTYTVNSDGSGSVSLTSKHSPQFAFALNSVAAWRAAGLQFLATNSSDGSGNLVVTGTALKQ